MSRWPTPRTAVLTGIAGLLVVTCLSVSYSNSAATQRSSGCKPNEEVYTIKGSASNANRSKERKEEPRELNEFYVITMLSVFNGKRWPKYDNYSLEELNERDEEYLETLEINVNRDYVKEVHLFYIDDDALKLVESRNFTNRHKIVPVKRERRLHMADFFIYSSRNLVDKAVIAMNGDIILGEGFELVDTKRMRDEHVLYSLTRHGVDKTGEGKKCETVNMCLNRDYQGSHDTHIFRLGSPLNETLILDRLDYPINMWQAENGMLWTFRNLLKYTVRNPCRVLRSYHNHCSKVHGPKETKNHNYSIMTLPHKGWVWKNIGEAWTPFENKLVYGSKTSQKH